nr:PREDICTED: elongation of very long chain fatty acids protein 6 isoform X2 [Latimeria chalumnae]|eukprot:XP_014353218.1 PREDICTED: elongation of very long chain fatty acids protein 6 isoform X2 [Latimeria chalumnae]
MNMSVLALYEYEFERLFNENEAIQWMQENWKKSFLFSALYAAFIFGGRHLMKQREKFELRKPLVLWSLGLALFRRYNLHHPEETEAHLPALVPSHHGAAVLLVLLQGHGGWWRLVYDHELRGPRCHVLLLCPAGCRLQGLTQVCHVHHPDTDHPDGDGLRSELPGLCLDAAGPVPVPRPEHHLVLPDVPQLLCALLSVFLRGVHQQKQKGSKGRLRILKKKIKKFKKRRRKRRIPKS